MKTTTAHIDLENPELLSIARLAIRRGQKLVAITKNAADAETIAYWSEYFGTYGMQFVRPLALKKSARLAQVGKEGWGPEDEEWYEGEVKKEKEEKTKTSALTPEELAQVKDDLSTLTSEERAQVLSSDGPVDQAQVMHDVYIYAECDPSVTLMPDAFEHSFKFALEAIKPEGAASISVDSVMTDVEQGAAGGTASMSGHAVCGVSLTTVDFAAFKATVESQLKKCMEEADFPCSVIIVEEPIKRAAHVACIIESARAGQTLARLASKYGEKRARIARRCAVKEAAGTPYSPTIRAQIKRAQAMIEEADNLVFTGEPASEAGAVADLGDGMTAQIKYMGTMLPKGFQWVIMKDDEFLAQGEEEMYEQAKGAVQSKRPKAESKVLQKDAALKRAMVESVGPVSFYEKIASAGGLSEYRVTKKTGSVVWLSVRAGKVENKVGEL